MQHEVDTEIWVVAGCLFEVSLPAEPAPGWRWVDQSPKVTLLGREAGGSRRQHLRFRAEAGGADAESVELRFENGEGAIATVLVRVAPETRRALDPAAPETPR